MDLSTASRPRASNRSSASAVAHRGTPNTAAFSLGKTLKEVQPLLVFLGGALVIPSSAGVMLFLALNAWALFATPFQMMKILTIQFFIVSLNGDLFNQPASYGLHLLTPFAIMASMFLRHREAVMRASPPFLQWNLLLGMGLLLLSVVSSTYPAVSVTKVIAFVAYTVALVQVVEVAWRQNPSAVVNWFGSTVVAAIVLSLPLLSLPLGFTRNGTGFNGILSHPQTFGLVIAAGVAYLLVSLVAERKLSVLTLGLAAIGTVELVRTESRGAIFSCFFAVAGWLGWEAVLRGRLQRSVVARLLAAGLLVAATLAVKHESAVALWEHVVSKSGRAGDVGLGEAYLQTRGRHAAEQLEVFARNPAAGVGFQVGAHRGFGSEIVYDPITGSIPISASVEKGNMYTAILEEGGVLGGVIMYGLMMIIAVPALRGPMRPEKVLVFVVLLSNLSEATFFSTTGIGGWNWQMLALAYASRNASWRP